MSITGEFIKFGGIVGIATGSTISVFILARLVEFLSQLDRLKEDFEELWKNSTDKVSNNDELVNLSHSHRAAKRQVEAGDVDRHMLERASEITRRKKGILGGRESQMYYVAHKKFKELKQLTDTPGKL